MWYKDSSLDKTDVVVDLSNLMGPITAYEDISDMLSEEQERKIVDYVRAATQMSWYSISRRYDHWRDADRAHDVWVPADTTKPIDTPLQLDKAHFDLSPTNSFSR